MKKAFILFPLVFTLLTVQVYAEDVAQFLQDISVTIRAGFSEGSGVIFSREVQIGEKKELYNFVWTAAHVVDGLRNTRSVIDSKTGQSKTVIEFDDAQVIKELLHNGRRVGEIKMDAQVIKYSDADTGHDLTLLRIRKPGYVRVSAKFYLEKEIPAIGTDLYHVGSLLGQMGSNSMTDGIISQHGRLIGNVVFDQSNCNAFPGSSGGGLYLKSNGLYVGMLVRGAGESFNLYVPVRRMHQWAKQVGVEWAMNPAIAVPPLSELHKMPVEANEGALKPHKKPHEHKFMIRDITPKQ